MSNWTSVALGDLAADTPNALATGPFGSSISSRHFVNAGVPVLRGSNLSLDVGSRLVERGFAFLKPAKAAEFRRSVARRGDLVFTCWGTVGQVGLIDNRAKFDEYIVSNKQMKLTPNPDRVDSLFLYYQLASPQMVEAVLQRAIGAAVPGFNLGQLRELPVDLPPIEEQRGIAATLGALDDKIESNRRTIQIASDLLDALSAGASDTLAGVRLGDLVKVERTAVDPKALADEQVDHFSLPAFDERTRPERVRASTIMSGKLAVTMPSILVSRLNPRFTRTWWAVPAHGVPALASTEFACLTTDGREDLAAVWLAVRDEYFRAELVRRASGTSGSHQRVRPDDLLSIDVPDVRDLSPSAKCDALALLDMIHERRIESTMLAALRDTLLPELLSGRVRVSEAREAVEEAVG